MLRRLFALAALLTTARAAQAVGLLLYFGMFFISGSGPPEGILPDGITRVARLLPLSYAVDILQGAWWKGGWDGGAVAVLAFVLAAAVAISLRKLRDV